MVVSPSTTGLSLSLSLARRALSFFWKCSSSSEPAASVTLQADTVDIAQTKGAVAHAQVETTLNILLIKLI